MRNFTFIWFKALEIRVGRFRRISRIIYHLASVCRSLALYARIASIDYVTLQLDISRTTSDAKFTASDFRKPNKFCWPASNLHRVLVPPQMRKDEDIAFIQKNMCTLRSFRNLSEDVQKKVSRAVIYQKYGRQRVICRCYHPAQNLYFVFSGKIRQSFTNRRADDEENEDGCNETRFFTKGDMFGEGEVIYGSARVADYVCEEPCEVLLIHTDDIQDTGLYDVIKSRCDKLISRLRSNNLLSTWCAEGLQQMVIEGSVTTFMANKVVDKINYKPAWLWFVLEGSCELRLKLSVPEYYKTHSRESSSIGPYPLVMSYQYGPENIMFLDDKARTMSFLKERSTCTTRENTLIHEDSIIKPSILKNKDDVNSRSYLASGPERSRENFPKSSTQVSFEKSTYKDSSISLHFMVHRLTSDMCFSFGGLSSHKRHLYLISKGVTLFSVPISLVQRYHSAPLFEYFNSIVNVIPKENELLEFHERKSRWEHFKKDFVYSTFIRSRENLSERQRRASYYWKPVQIIQSEYKHSFPFCNLQQPIRRENTFGDVESEEKKRQQKRNTTRDVMMYRKSISRESIRPTLRSGSHRSRTSIR